MTPPKQINILALVILACGLMLSVMMWRYTSRIVVEDYRKDFDFQAIQAEDALKRRIQSFSEVLTGLQSVFVLDQHLSRAEFRRVVFHNGFLDRYPGITVAGYIQAVPAADKTAFEQQVRQDRRLDPVGYPHFAIKPEGERAEYFVITYLEPMAGNEKAFGLDVGSESVRREGAERARDTGEPAATGGITLVQENGSQKAFFFMPPCTGSVCRSRPSSKGARHSWAWPISVCAWAIW
ncbi:sensor histidine kinase, CHASE domain-containing [Sulfuricella denitrificans skB26]|uniref:Sensor histidine kinase, CHASE domain-containing n=1 Tax=Sulfuricella denitrificans (strain DSM 22764 / NBRC 105220 / skB26) TaxID=1163617 RepID=S6AC57_SULDS|nr:sensor histidine kinase, CHASE domain-containing [Sulfuricella denitrificans skB26]